MKCLACGAEMRLMDVRTEPTTPFGIERRVFQCSSCRQSAQRLRFDRSRLPVTTSATMTHTNAPAIRQQGDSSAPASRAALVEEKRHSSIAVKEQAGARAPPPGRGRSKSFAVGRWRLRSEQPLWMTMVYESHPIGGLVYSSDRDGPLSASVSLVSSTASSFPHEAALTE